MKCPSCNTDVQQGASFCPTCGKVISAAQTPLTQTQPAETSLRKKGPNCFVIGCLAIVAIFVISVIVAAIVSGGNPSPTTHTETRATPAPAPTPTRNPLEAVVNDTRYHLDSYSETDTIGANDYSAGTKASGRFLILHFTVEDLSNKTRDIDLAVSKLKDADGNEYDSSSEGDTALVMSGDSSAELLGTQLQPHLPKKVSIVFDVPPSQKSFDLTIPSAAFSLGSSGVISFSI